MSSPLGTELLPKTKLTDDLLPRVLTLPDYNPEKGKILSWLAGRAEYWSQLYNNLLCINAGTFL